MITFKPQKIEMSKAPKQSPLGWFYILLFAVIPLIWIPSLVDLTLIPRQMFTTLALGALLVLNWKKLSATSWKLSRPGLAYAGFVLMLLISSFVAINPVESWAIISKFGLLLTFFLTTVHLLRHQLVSQAVIVKGIVLFAGISSIIVLFQLFELMGKGDFFENIYAIKGLFSHKNLASGALMLTIPFLIMGTHLQEKTWKRASLILLFLIVAEIFVLRTRGVWVSLITSSILVALTYFISSNQSIKKASLPYKTLGGLIATAGVVLAIVFLAPGVKDKITDAGNFKKRTAFWNNSFEMIGENPVLGVGAGNWKINFPKYGLGSLDQNVMQGITHIQRPHNDFIWVLAETGPLGFLFYLSFFAFAILRLRRHLKDAVDSQTYVTYLAILLGLSSYLIFSLVDFPMERMPHNLLMLTMVALLFTKEEKRDWEVKGKQVVSILSILVVFSGVVSSYRWKGEMQSVAVLEANSRRDAQKLVRATEKAINPFYNMDSYSNPIVYFESQAKFALRDLEGAYAASEEAVTIHPYNIVTLNLWANILSQKAQLDEALVNFEKIVAISPKYEDALLNIGVAYLNKKQYVEAVEALNKVHYNSENKKFIQLCAFVIPKLIETKAEHGKFKNLINYIESKGPANQGEYYIFYKEYRQSLIPK